MKFAWTGDGAWRGLERGLVVQARPFRRAWTAHRPWRGVEGRCVVQANCINAGIAAGWGLGAGTGGCWPDGDFSTALEMTGGLRSE